MYVKLVTGCLARTLPLMAVTIPGCGRSLQTKKLLSKWKIQFHTFVVSSYMPGTVVGTVDYFHSAFFFFQMEDHLFQ